MILRKFNRSERRGGATTVEAAFVISIFLMFLFGLFEYCRFIFFLHVATNAARDGARYAVVNVDKPTNFDFVNTTHGGVPYQSVRNYVLTRLANNGNMLDSTTITVFPCDSTQLSQPTPVVARKPAGMFPTLPRNPTSPYGGELAWNAASFGERIAVRINGTYRPILPNFIMMRSTYNMDIIVTANSEG